MRASIVTISFNQVKYLRQCLDSVDHERKASSVEHICVDAGSTDGSAELLERSGRDHLLLGPDAGPADGLNKGFAVATGDVFAFINSDDYLLPGSVGHAIRLLEHLPDVDVLLCGGYIVDDEGRHTRRAWPSRFGARDYVFGAVTLFQQGMFFRRTAYEAVSGFNVQNSTCWDAEFLLQLSLAGCNIALDDTPVAAFRIYEESITGSQRFAKKYSLDQARLFSQVVGRAPRSADVVERTGRRVLKIFRERRRFLGKA